MEGQTFALIFLLALPTGTLSDTGDETDADTRGTSDTSPGPTVRGGGGGGGSRTPRLGARKQGRPTRQMKCKRMCLTLAVLFVLAAATLAPLAAEPVTMDEGQEMSRDCQVRCAEMCDMGRRATRIMCFGKCLADCIA